MSPPARARPRPRVELLALGRSDRSEFLTLMRASRAFHRGRVDPPLTPASFARYLAQLREPDRRGFAIRRREDGALLGVVNLNEISRGPAHTAFLGYYLGAPHAGRGYMREALELVQERAFREMRLHRLEADIQPDNRASIALVRRCGFRFEGHLRRFLKIGGRWRDHVVYARLAEDWRAGSATRSPSNPGVSLRFRPRLGARALDGLRRAVGWEPLGARAAPFLRGLFASAAAFDGRRPVAWLGVVSDGAQHAFLVDVMVAPDHQRRGVGSALVRFASERLRGFGIRLLHVDFVPELASFYERCGFEPGLAGVAALEPTRRSGTSASSATPAAATKSAR